MSFKNNKYTILFFLVILLVITVFVYYYILNNNKENTQNTESKNTSTYSEITNNNIVLPTQGNDMVVKTNSKSTIRVINEFDKTMFEGKKSILFMWGSWCSNCAVEMNDIQKILDYYKGSNINVVFISHDFEIETLITYVERTDVNFDTEILLDLGRVIRASIDPEASTVPVTYFLNEKVEVTYKYDKAITFDEVQKILKELKWI